MIHRAIIAWAALSAASTAAAAVQVTLGDRQWYSEGSCLAYANPWGAVLDPSLSTTSYSDKITFTAGKLPSATLSWRYPATPPKKASVYGYDHIACGNYDGGAVLMPLAPIRVSAIGALAFSYQTTYSAPKTGFNGLLEFYLTSSAGADQKKVAEIGWLYHTPAATLAYMEAGHRLGTFKDRFGVNWTVALHWDGASGRYILFMPAEDGHERLAGHIDTGGALRWLVALKTIDSAWWWNGVAIGAEPLAGSGSITVKQFTITGN